MNSDFFQNRFFDSCAIGTPDKNWIQNKTLRQEHWHLHLIVRLSLLQITLLLKWHYSFCICNKQLVYFCKRIDSIIHPSTMHFFYSPYMHNNNSVRNKIFSWSNIRSLRKVYWILKSIASLPNITCSASNDYYSLANQIFHWMNIHSLTLTI